MILLVAVCAVPLPADKQARSGTACRFQPIGLDFQVLCAFQPRGGMLVVWPREHARWPLAPRAPLRSQRHPCSGK